MTNQAIVKDPEFADNLIRNDAIQMLKQHGIDDVKSV